MAGELTAAEMLVNKSHSVLQAQTRKKRTGDALQRLSLAPSRSEQRRHAAAAPPLEEFECEARVEVLEDGLVVVDDAL